MPQYSMLHFVRLIRSVWCVQHHGFMGFAAALISDMKLLTHKARMHPHDKRQTSSERYLIFTYGKGTLHLQLFTCHKVLPRLAELQLPRARWGVQVVHVVVGVRKPWLRVNVVNGQLACMRKAFQFQYSEETNAFSPGPLRASIPNFAYANSHKSHIGE